MNQPRRERRRSARCPLDCERLEGRQVLSKVPSPFGLISPLLTNPTAYPANHPNTPVLTFALPTSTATFLDPSVAIKSGHTVVMGLQTYVAPYATLDGRAGAIKIGGTSVVLDNATLKVNPGPSYHAPVMRVGEQVVIGPGAKVLGPSTIGGYGAAAQPTEIGARAVVDNATIEPGAIVSPLARVGPGVTVPSGFRVLPGKNVTNNAEASNPALGKVVKVSATDVSTLKQALADGAKLAAGYTNLYQGSSATGANPGADPTVKGVNNGYLPGVLGASPSPGPSYIKGTTETGPLFPTPHQGLAEGLLFNFPGRVIGKVEFLHQRAHQLAHHIGRANSIRADEGQPIVIGSIRHTGRHVTIGSPLSGELTIGDNFRAGKGAVVLGGPGAATQIGNDVQVGAGAVLDHSSLGDGSSVGAGAYLQGSTFPANTVIPPRAIYINNQFMGYVQS